MAWLVSFNFRPFEIQYHCTDNFQSEDQMTVVSAHFASIFFLKQKKNKWVNAVSNLRLN